MKTSTRTLFKSLTATHSYVWLIAAMLFFGAPSPGNGQALSRSVEVGKEVGVDSNSNQASNDQGALTGLNPLCNCEVRLSVKPNPVQDVMHLTHGIKGGAEITITDLVGRSHTLTKVPMEAEISVLGWPKGIYMVSLRLGQDRRVQTILVR